MVKETHRQKLRRLGIPGSTVCPAIDLFLSADRQKVQYHPIHLESSVPLVFLNHRIHYSHISRRVILSNEHGNPVNIADHDHTVLPIPVHLFPHVPQLVPA